MFTSTVLSAMISEDALEILDLQGHVHSTSLGLRRRTAFIFLDF